MSEHLYFIFGLPPFEIKLKNRKLMVNHIAVKFKAENYSFHLGMIGLYFGNLGKKFVSFKILATDERVEFHGEISPILARCRKSHREFDEI